MKRTGDVVVVDSEPLMRHQEQLDKRFAALERIKQLEVRRRAAACHLWRAGGPPGGCKTREGRGGGKGM